MGEPKPEINVEKPENFEPKDLNFEELEQHYKQILELAKTSFRKTEFGFMSVDGYGIGTAKYGDKFKLNSLPNWKELKESIMSGHISDTRYNTLEELRDDIITEIEKCGGRIIE